VKSARGARPIGITQLYTRKAALSRDPLQPLHFRGIRWPARLPGGRGMINARLVTTPPPLLVVCGRRSCLGGLVSPESAGPHLFPPIVDNPCERGVR
jgi:hypothetical protein